MPGVGRCWGLDALARRSRLSALAGLMRNALAGVQIVVGAVGVVGALGDLIESMFKRSVNTKDSAGLLPGGGGGILDMFDSLTFSPAVLYVYLAWFVGQSVSS